MVNPPLICARRSRAGIVGRWSGVATMVLLPALGLAQGGQTRVMYDVEFSVQGSLLDPNCTASGSDVLTGTLVGFEPAPPGEENPYVGMLIRRTRITTCGERMNAAGVGSVCSMTYAGDGIAEVVFSLWPDQRGGWLKYIDPAERPTYARLLPSQRPTGTYGNTVTGTCDPAELAALQQAYDAGETAGSPSGQPIRITTLPPPFYPITYAPAPPESIWTLRILARRP